MMLPRLYPILDVEAVQRRGWELEGTARALAAAGVELLQLRDKRSSPQEVLAHAAVLSRTFGQSCQLVMNDRADLALLAGWRAVHVGHQDLPPEAVRSVFGTVTVTVGVSTHNPAQVRAAEESTADYVAIGPVFHTSSKADTEPVVGLEGVREARRSTRKPLVAIGGITQANALAVLAAGADSVAVIGGLLTGAKELEEATRDFLRLLR